MGLDEGSKKSTCFRRYVNERGLSDDGGTSSRRCEPPPLPNVVEAEALTSSQQEQKLMSARQVPDSPEALGALSRARSLHEAHLLHLHSQGGGQGGQGVSMRGAKGRGGDDGDKGSMQRGGDVQPNPKQPIQLFFTIGL